MSNERAIYYAFVTGEVAPAFWGRTDLSKYDLGAALLENFYADYRGGTASRQGSEFCAHLPAEQGYKLARFRGTNDDYLMVFTAQKLRFMQKSKFITEPPVAVTSIVSAENGNIGATGHPYALGDMVEAPANTGMTELNGRYFLVSAVTTNSFVLSTLNNEPVSLVGYTALDGSETFARVYTVSHPYGADDLRLLNVQQRYNEVYLTHINYIPRVLTFVSATNWTVAFRILGAGISPPANLVGTPSGTGTAGTTFAVSAVNKDGIESVISAQFLESAMLNYTVTLGSYTLTWDPVAKATSYNVYRGLVQPDGDKVTFGGDLAYIGSSFGTEFTDNNIVADFTKPPVNAFDPFAPLTITAINVTNPGTGYPKTTTISLTGGGEGFRGQVVVDTSGKISGVKIISAGKNYVNPTVVLGDVGAGTGAVLTAEATGVVGKTNPSMFLVFQQRGIYFASETEPATLWASQPGNLSNYDFSTVVTAKDGYTFTLDSVAVEPIKHALAIRNGLLIFTDDGIVQLRAETGKAVSAVNAIAEPQVYTDVSDTAPIAINLDVLFLTGEGASLNSLLYTEYTESFQMQDLSVLAGHLFGPDKQVTRMTYNPNPSRLVYMPRSDGRMLVMTHVREQEVNAWAQYTTLGSYKDTCEVREDGSIFVYQLVERFLQGAWRMCLERIPNRDATQAENYWGVDAGKNLPKDCPSFSLSAEAVEGNTQLRANGAAFSSTDVGRIVYYAGGKLEVTEYVDPTSVNATYLRAATEFIKFGDRQLPLKVKEGDWCIATPVSEITGLWHLEGETISIAYDGNAELSYVVEGGKVTLPVPSTKAYAGLPYVCTGASLPMVVTNKLAEGQRNKIFGAVPRVESTRGLAFGPSLDQMEEMADRTDEDWGEPINGRTDVSRIFINSTYEYNAQIYWQQVYPLPASLLGFVLDADLGEI